MNLINFKNVSYYFKFKTKVWRRLKKAVSIISGADYFVNIKHSNGFT